MFEQYIKSGRVTLEYLGRYREVAASVKEIVREGREDVRVYVFGSVVRGDFTAASDIDVLLVFDEVGRNEAAELKAKVLRRMGFAVPLQIHVVTQKEFKEWYLRFVDEFIEV